MQPRLLHEPLRLAGASLLRLQSDGRLVALARDGHDPAFAAIVDRYRGALVRYCTRLLGPERAEDAVQQTLLNAHQAMNDADREIQLRPWLYRIAHNVSLNVLRGARETTELKADSADTLVVEDVVAQRQRLRETLAAIEALPEPQRDALLLRELEGRSHDEIAAALGVSVGGARQHLYRARASVRAAVTAITPYPLLARLMDMATSSGAGESTMARAGEVAVGTGMGAVATKVGVSALAAGALVGGAIHADRATHHHHSHKPHTSVVHTVHHAVAKPAAPVAAAIVAAGASSSSPSSGSPSGTLGGGDDHGHGTTTHHRHHGSGSSSGSNGSSGSGSGSSGHGSDDHPTGLAVSGGEAGDDHGGSSGSGSSGSGSGGHHARRRLGTPRLGTAAAARAASAPAAARAAVAPAAARAPPVVAGPPATTRATPVAGRRTPAAAPAAGPMTAASRSPRPRSLSRPARSPAAATMHRP